ncbi:MAG: M23 family metallopeptidase [Leptolyngbyaceae cyanobacterium CSU_1_3]|nr:M23 family metallopeptidase [Leptolyngbyaceae cyanobacterium CSU_1_3]
MTPVGKSIIIRHANGWASYYTHLTTLDVQRGQRVVAGDPLGTIGASPLHTVTKRRLMSATASLRLPACR